MNLTKINEYGYIYYVDQFNDIWIECNECGKIIPEKEFEMLEGMCEECYMEDLDSLIKELEDEGY